MPVVKASCGLHDSLASSPFKLLNNELVDGNNMCRFLKIEFNLLKSRLSLKSLHLLLSMCELLSTFLLSSSLLNESLTAEHAGIQNVHNAHCSFVNPEPLNSVHYSFLHSE